MRFFKAIISIQAFISLCAMHISKDRCFVAVDTVLFYFFK